VPTGITLDLNGKTLNGNVIGTIKMNGGKFSTVEDVANGLRAYNMVAPADYTGGDFAYLSTDGVFTMTLRDTKIDLTFNSGAVTLANNWQTDTNQVVTIASGASFTVPAGKTFLVQSGTSVVVNGTVTVGGTVTMQAGTTLKAPAGLNVVGADANVAVTYADGTYTAVEAVAKIGNVGYATLAEALAAAKSGDTVTILGNVNIADGEGELPYGESYPEYKSEYVITADKGITVSGGTMTIDNGYFLGFVVLMGDNDVTLENITITGNSVMNVYAEDESRTGTGTLTLKGVNISSATGAGICTQPGRVVLEDCTVINTGLGSGNSTNFESAVSAAVGSNITIKSGTYKSTNGWAVYTFGTANNASTVTIKGGSFEGKIEAGASGGADVITIEGGTFTSTELIETAGGNIVITGGSFNVDPTSYVADGYIATESNGTWTVAAE